MGMNPLGDLMESTMEKLREMVKVDTVIGNPIMTPDGVTLIPISKVSFGFASGGTDLTGKNQAASSKDPFSGASGAGVKVTPMAFVIVKNGTARVMTIEPPASNALDRIVENAPDIIDKVSDLMNKNKGEPEG